MAGVDHRVWRRRAHRFGSGERTVDLVGVAAAVTTALIAGGECDSAAFLAGELGVRALKRCSAERSEGDRESEKELAHYTVAVLSERRAAASSLGSDGNLRPRSSGRGRSHAVGAWQD